jgi:hypothetical protein
LLPYTGGDEDRIFKMASGRAAGDPNVDPDAAAIIVVVSAALGILNHGLGLAGKLTGAASRRGRRASSDRTVRSSILQLNDDLRHLEVDVETLKKVFDAEDISQSHPFELGRPAFISRDRFRTYQQASKDVFLRLSRLNETVTRLDRIAAREDAGTVSPSSDLSEEITARLNRLLRNPNLTIGQALESLSAAIDTTRSLLESLSDVPTRA